MATSLSIMSTYTYQPHKSSSLYRPHKSSSPYRPHDPGHDYHGRGTYLITLVVSGRRPLLSRFSTELGREATLNNGREEAIIGNQKARYREAGIQKAGIQKAGNQEAAIGDTPLLCLTDIGEVVKQEWMKTPFLQAQRGNKVAVLACVCMPDHFHGVIEVIEPLERSLGDIIQAFKATCTSQWQQQHSLGTSYDRLVQVDFNSPSTPDWLKEKALTFQTEAALIRNISKRQRLEYYALRGKNTQAPLFDDNYDDTICLDSRHREAMVGYVKDNPRRAILRRSMPDFMQRCLHVMIGDRSYGAFGNLFLLRWARKIQIRCHRKHPISNEPYETTTEYKNEHDQWISAILCGQTVIVTPGISRGELLMKNECIEKGYPLIHLQKEPIGPYWKPEQQRFNACINGRLLILAPWGLDQMEGVAGVPSTSDYSRFHNLNILANELCSFAGQAYIIRQ